LRSELSSYYIADFAKAVNNKICPGIVRGFPIISIDLDGF